jgi:uncharacterized protein DUF3105
MSSRQEEKERRRRERLAAEEEAARRDAGKQRLQWIGGALLALVAVGVIVGAVIVPAISGSDDKGGGTGGQPKAATEAAAKIPAAQNTDLRSSVSAAGCTLKSFPSEGRQHSANAADWNYKTNPPTSGTHNPVPAQDGVYPFGAGPNKGETTHSLEHGRIDVQYGTGVTRAQYAQLEALVGENQGYHQLLFRNQTTMPFAVAATAWTQQLGCKTMNAKVFDAVRNFRERYTDQGPEAVP